MCFASTETGSSSLKSTEKYPGTFGLAAPGLIEVDPLTSPM